MYNFIYCISANCISPNIRSSTVNLHIQCAYDVESAIFALMEGALYSYKSMSNKHTFGTLPKARQCERSEGNCRRF